MLLKTTQLIFAILLIAACNTPQTIVENQTEAEKLGFEKGKRVLILHADDIGMCPEANEAAMKLLGEGFIQSVAVMAPCPSFEDFMNWAKDKPSLDVGMHLTHTSEWQTYRWGPVSSPDKVPGLIDPDGKLWHEVPGVVGHATVEEIEIEVRAQIEAAIALGWTPTHIDTHMGTLYSSPDYVAVFLKVAEEYNIPANVLDMSTPEEVEKVRAIGFPIDDEVIAMVKKYKLPKLDNFTSVPDGATYEETKKNFFLMVKALEPGLTEVIFHPAYQTENMKTITNSWQQRAWEAQLFTDPEVIEFFKTEGIVFTNWKEMMKRHKM